MKGGYALCFLHSCLPYNFRRPSFFVPCIFVVVSGCFLPFLRFLCCRFRHIFVRLQGPAFSDLGGRFGGGRCWHIGGGVLGSAFGWRRVEIGCRGWETAVGGWEVEWWWEAKGDVVAESHRFLHLGQHRPPD
jgi:hypothetical protein